MRELMRFDPMREIDTALGGERMFVPSFEVKETKDAYVFKADLPGVKEDDVEISLNGNRLIIAGQREEERQDQNDQYYATERTYGRFVRSFTLPDGADADSVRAELKSGVLTVTVPKKPEVQPRRITVGKGGGAAAPGGGGGGGDGGGGGSEKAKTSS